MPLLNYHPIKKRILSLFILLLCTTSIFCSADNRIKSIEQFSSKGFEVKFIAIHDPLVLVLESVDGNRIETRYDPQYFEMLHRWETKDEQSSVPRRLIIIYTTDQGVILKDPVNNNVIPLKGAMSSHPIDWAATACRNYARTTIDDRECKDITLKAWDNELNRVYQSLGGSENHKLRDAQRAWLKFRDRSIDFLNDKYITKQGTIHGLYYMDDIIELTRSQTLRLQRYNTQ